MAIVLLSANRRTRWGRTSPRYGDATPTPYTGPTFRSGVSQGLNNGTTITFTRPSGSGSGDVLFAIFNCPAANTIATPTGWTLHSGPDQPGGSGVKLYCFYRVADNTATDLPTWTYSASSFAGGAMGAVQGAAASFLDNSTAVGLDGDSGFTVPTCVNTAAQCLALTMLVSGNASNTFSGFTAGIERFGGQVNYVSYSFVTENAPDATTTNGGWSGTYANSPQSIAMYIVTIKP